MNREIKFRGYDKIAQSWIVGGICFDSDIKGRVYITTNFDEMYKVEPNSVGQFLGLKDKTNEEIYEGDIVNIESRGSDFTCYIEYPLNLIPINEFSKQWEHMLYRPDFEGCEVIGNIYENPELLKSDVPV